MSLGLSPSIHIEEEDFQNSEIVPGANFAALAGNFAWGSANMRITITNENELVNVFGKPNDKNYLDWFAASAHLKYNNNLYVVRAMKENIEEGALSRNASSVIFSSTASIRELKIEHVLQTGSTEEYEPFSFPIGSTISGANNAQAKIIKVVSNGEENKTLLINVISGTFSKNAEITCETGTSPTVTNKAKITDVSESNLVSYECGDEYLIENPLVLDSKRALPLSDDDHSLCKLAFVAKSAGVPENVIAVRVCDSSTFNGASMTGNSDKSEFKRNFGVTEIADYQLAVQVGCIQENNGIKKFMPYEGETFIVSTKKGTTNEFGRSDYIENYINSTSQYVYCFMNETTELVSVSDLIQVELGGGFYELPGVDEYKNAYDLFSNAEEVNVDVIFSAGADELENGLSVLSHIKNLILKRKDCRQVIGAKPSVLAGQPRTVAINNLKNYIETELSDMTGNNSYGAFYGNAKYIYDSYNGVYRWVSIAGDVAGIYTQTLMWMAPAGLRRGIITDAIKLAVNPSEPERDELYPQNINPVYTIRGTGHVIFGQKTLFTSYPSIFNRVDNRGLFIYLEKNTMQYLRAYQFEKNNKETRNNLLSDIKPVFDYVLGRGGIAAYQLTCDDTNNPNSYSNVLNVDAAIQIVGSIEWIVMKFRAVPNMVNVVEQE